MPQKRKHFANIGDIYGAWTVVEHAPSKGGHKYVTCRCECGTKKSVHLSNLARGKTKSCGCLARKLTSKRLTTHGLAWIKKGKMRPLYGVWLAMKGRCCNPKNKSYSRYGGRGIRICKEWEESYSLFHKWAMKNGYKKGLTIERIDNGGNYEPANCTWSDRITQANNRRTNHILIYKAKEYTLAQLCRKFGLKYSNILYRLSQGWSLEDAVRKPLNNRGDHNCLSLNR